MAGQAYVDQVERYTVLVLDTSGTASFTSGGELIYEANTAIEYVKQAANKFLSGILTADGTNYVAVVSYKSTASVVSSFTDNIDKISNKVNSLTASDTVRDISAGLDKAYELLNNVSNEANVKKNVVLFTTGMTNHGEHSYEGLYGEDTIGSNWYRVNTGVNLYAYANHAHESADNLKNIANLYTIGLFQTMDDMPNEGKEIAEFFQLTAFDLATSSKYYYPVDDPNDLEFVFGEVADDITNVEPIPFKFRGEFKKDEDTESVCYYNDSYFYDSPSSYQKSLATMSLCLELAACTSYDVTKNAWDPIKATQNAENLLTGKIGGISTGDTHLGFSDFARSPDMEAAPNADSIGAIAANKKINDGDYEYTLIALAVRGGGYGSEWASNFTIGESGNHQGFDEAKENVLSFLSNYIDEYDISGKIKLWIVGYSRAGITANMVAGELNRRGYSLPSKVIFEPLSQLYCYTFEAPMGVWETNIAGEHDNIHNIINFNDFVTHIAPRTWEFERYNQKNDHHHPIAMNDEDWDDAYNAMIDELEKLGYSEKILTDLGYINLKDEDKTNDLIVPEVSIQQNLMIDMSKVLPFGEPLWWWEDSKVSTKKILIDGVDFLADDVLKSRGYYTENLQYVMRQVFGIVTHYYGMGAGLADYAGEVFDIAQFMQNMSELFTIENIVYIISPVFSLNPFYTNEDRVDDVKLRLMEKMGSIFREYAEIKGFIGALTEILKDVILQVAFDALNNNTDSVNLVIEFVDVMKKGVLRAHFPEVCLAWVSSEDPYYNEKLTTDAKLISSITRVVHINCPVDINVYDGAGILVASIVNDSVIENISSIICVVDSNGEKIVYLPGDEDYTIDIIATNNGYVSYAVNEYNFVYNNETRILNYYDIPVNAGDTLKGVIPKIEDDELNANDYNGSTANYQLQDNAHKIIPVDSEYVGSQIATLYHNVTLLKEGNGGYISGAGEFLEGHFAQVKAQVLPSSEFYGWYIDGNLVSTDEVYRFAVIDDITLTAKFKDVEFHEMKLKSTTGGKITSVEGYYSAGVQVAVVAEAEDGYEFDYWSTSNGGIFENVNDEYTFLEMPDNDVVVTAHFKPVDDFNLNYWTMMMIVLRNKK